jgi:large subunit ribosomal protein L4|nr:50S ribosomal protein L4 [Candidatus Acidoferrales bacterium]
MPVVDVKNLAGKTVGQVDLADGVFAARVNPHLLHETTRWYLSGQRAGTHKTKGRADVAGSGRKLWKQKGTGRARIGSIRSPLWRKGGTVHGPVPHKYSYRLPRKMVLGALRSALSMKLAEEKLIVIDGWELETHKTKPFREALGKLNGDVRTILLVDNDGNRNLELASRNLEGITLSLSRDLQVYDLLKHDRLMLSKDAALRLSELGAAGGFADAGDEVSAEAKPDVTHIKPAATEVAGTKAAPKKPAHKAAHKAAKAPALKKSVAKKAAAKPAKEHKAAAKKPAKAAKSKSTKGKGSAGKSKE